MIPRSLARIGPALACAFSLTLAAAPSHAQTKPAVRDLGVEVPTSAIYIGNSFFYYNNSLHGHFGQLDQVFTDRLPVGRLSECLLTLNQVIIERHDQGQRSLSEKLN